MIESPLVTYLSRLSEAQREDAIRALGMCGVPDFVIARDARLPIEAVAVIRAQGAPTVWPSPQEIEPLLAWARECFQASPIDVQEAAICVLASEGRDVEAIAAGTGLSAERVRTVLALRSFTDSISSRN